MTLRSQIAVKFFAAALFLAAAVNACSSGADADNACMSSFLSEVDDGRVVSVNGLTVAHDYDAYYVTAWSDDERAVIIRRQCEDGIWGAGAPLFPDSRWSDYQPVLSEDGERLYFTSTRSVSGDEAARQNVWMLQLGRDSLAPEVIEPIISPFWDGHAVEIEPGKLLFASARNGDDKMVDIFELDLDTATIRPIDILNSASSDNDMAYDYHSGTLVFSRYDPVSEEIDLFITIKSAESWLAPHPLNAVNSDEWDMSPAFTPDGRYFLFKRGDGPFRRIETPTLRSN